MNANTCNLSGGANLSKGTKVQSRAIRHHDNCDTLHARHAWLALANKSSAISRPDSVGTSESTRTLRYDLNTSGYAKMVMGAGVSCLNPERGSAVSRVGFVQRVAKQQTVQQATKQRFSTPRGCRNVGFGLGNFFAWCGREFASGKL